MWLSKALAKGRVDFGGEMSTGEVTIAGEQRAVMLQGERRELGVLCPGGIIWSPAVGDEVAVLRSEDGERFIIGTFPEVNALPGEIILKSGENSIRIGKSGIEIYGNVSINGVSLG